MSDLAEHPKEPTISELAAELAQLRDRVDDLEDSRELETAIQRNGDQTLIPWRQAKKDLGL